MTRNSKSHSPVVAQKTKTMTRDNKAHLFYLATILLVLSSIIIAISF